MSALRWPTALLLGAALAVGVAACGGDDQSVSDVVPKSTPALTAPDDTSLPEVDSSTTTTSTSTTTTATTTTATGGTSGTSGTGGTATSGTATTGGTSTTTTSGAASGGFSDFCSSNPGACAGN
jgi:hypothetical protein